jgi:chemotaxis protein methyltransferase CheR
MGFLNLEKLTTRQFKKYCDIVYSECGINLTEGKRELLNARISKRLRKLRIQPDKYLSVIQSDKEELNNFLDAVSTNHTFFFRESKSFKYLDRGSNDIWCAASSSGEEPYSIAVHCMELGFQPSILATDISNTCLTKGKNAIYPIQSTTKIPEPLLRRYFQKGQGKWDAYVRVKTDIKKMVTFKRFNLLKDTLPSKEFDIVFCRNVMIYFDNPSKELVVARLFACLKKDGYFIIGGSESLNGLNHTLKYIEPSVYKKC